jgi:uncharacterized protein YbjQ (UPF0145 family)
LQNQGELERYLKMAEVLRNIALSDMNAPASPVPTKTIKK